MAFAFILPPNVHDGWDAMQNGLVLTRRSCFANKKKSKREDLWALPLSQHNPLSLGSGFSETSSLVFTQNMLIYLPFSHRISPGVPYHLLLVTIECRMPVFHISTLLVNYTLCRQKLKSCNIFSLEWTRIGSSFNANATSLPLQQQ